MGEKRERVKQKLYDFICDEQYKPMRLKDIRFLLQVKDADKKRVEEALNELVEEGKITVTPKGKYKKLDDKFLVGDYIGNKKGYGFVRVEGYKDDFFIPAKFSMGAFHGDRVMIAPDSYTKQGKSTEAKVTQILKRGLTTIVGTYDKQQNFGFVIPDNQKVADDIFVAKKDSMGAMTGHKVVCRITNYGADHKSPEGEIIEILGHVNDPGTDILSVVRAYDIPVEYPDKVMDSLKDIPDEVDEADFVGRTDFRALPTVTIDGEDAKDLDDAVRVTKLENGNYRLDVHIADVSHYVKEGSFLDKEAQIRGTSIYMLSRVIPMLPKELSNGICSLNAGEDRFTLSCSMEINPEGKTISTEVYKGIINVRERMNYHDVQKIIDKSDETVLKRYEKYIKDFELMAELATILKERRLKQGYLNLDIPESKIDLDENGRAVNVGKYETSFSNEIIEQFMLSANEAIAEKFYWLEAPFIYRVHEDPDLDKIKDLNKFLFNFGLKIKVVNEKVYPTEVSKILEEIKGKDEEKVVSTLILRTLKVARYESENKGHFGIASKYYCHFTSPIRRYPDLFIHRIISKYLEDNYVVDEDWLEEYQEKAEQRAASSSDREKVATKVERDSEDLKKAEFMQDKIGEEYEGIVSSVTQFGIFVELENTVEGLIRFENLGDEYFIYDEERKRLIGEKTNTTYKIGDKVKIRVISANKMLRQIDFEIVKEPI